MMNGKEYLKTLKAMKIVLHIDGEAVSDFTSHPVMKPAVNALRATYDLASDPQLNPELHRLIVAESDLTDGKISRFLTIVKSQDDLMGRMKL